MSKGGEKVADRKEDIKVFIPEYAKKVMDIIKDGGEDIYIVGGCLRDTMLGKLPDDHDMTVSCRPERTELLLNNRGIRTVATGLKHGTVTAISDGKPIEITTFRIDGEYFDSRHPESVSFTRKLADDLCRRDFTVNAMAYNEENGLIDLFGGEADLKSGIIRAVGDPKKRFEEDALRIMRAFRFSAQLGFEIDEKTLCGAEERKAGLEKISRERICTELLKLLSAEETENVLSLMYRRGIFQVIAKDSLTSTDIFDVERIFGLISAMPKKDVARLGLLLCLWGRDGDAAATKFVSSLKCSNRLKNGALAVRAVAFENISTAKDASRICVRYGRENALYGALASMLLENSPTVAHELVEKNKAPVSLSELDVNGKMLMELGIEGKDIGKVLAALLEATVDGSLKNERQELLKMAEFLKNNI